MFRQITLAACLLFTGGCVATSTVRTIPEQKTTMVIEDPRHLDLEQRVTDLEQRVYFLEVNHTAQQQQIDSLAGTIWNDLKPDQHRHILLPDGDKP